MEGAAVGNVLTLPTFVPSFIIWFGVAREGGRVESDIRFD